MLPLIVAILITVSDQVTKEWVRGRFYLGESHAVIDGFFNLTYVRNTGAAWGMLGGQNNWLTLLSIVMLFVMVICRRTFLSNTWDHRLALGLMIGGICGNLIDRIKLGWVTDFLDFYIGQSHWPSFNIADAGICTGVGIYMISALWLSSHPLNDQQPKTSAVPQAGAASGGSSPS